MFVAGMKSTRADLRASGRFRKQGPPPASRQASAEAKTGGRGSLSATFGRRRWGKLAKLEFWLAGSRIVEARWVCPASLSVIAPLRRPLPPPCPARQNHPSHQTRNEVIALRRETKGKCKSCQTCLGVFFFSLSPFPGVPLR